MAVIAVTGIPAAGVNYTVTTASSADWASVSNSTYFYDLTDKLVHYKDSTGTILEIFGTGGGVNIYNANGTLTSARTVTLNAFNLAFFGTGQQMQFNQNDGAGRQAYHQLTLSGFQAQVIHPTLGSTGLDLSENMFRTDATDGSGFHSIAIQEGTSFINYLYNPAFIGGGLAFKTTTSSIGFNINDEYTFPTADGTLGQVLTTDGAGTVSWTTGGSGSSVNIYNTDGTITANRTVSLLNRTLEFNGLGGSILFNQSNGVSESSTIQQTANLLTLASQDGDGFYSESKIFPTGLTSISQNSSFKSVFSQTLNTIYSAIENVDFSTVLFKTELTSFGLRINGQYTLPTTDGVAGQVLTTNGAGGVTWKNDPYVAKANYTFRGILVNNNSATIGVEGGVTMSTSASVQAQAVINTNFASKHIKARYYASVVSTGRYSGTRGTSQLWFLGAGFLYTCDFNISDTVYGATCQQFYGMQGSVQDLNYGGASVIAVNTLINCIGVGSDAGDTNLQIFHNDAAGTCTKIDLGAGFPANRTNLSFSTTVYSVLIYNGPSSSDVHVKVINAETGASVETLINTNLPATTLGLNFYASRAMGAAVTNTGQFDLSKLGVYSIL